MLKKAKKKLLTWNILAKIKKRKSNKAKKLLIKFKILEKGWKIIHFEVILFKKKK